MIEDKEWETLKVIQRHADLEGKTMLEIGCGDGRVSAMLSGKASRLTAMDPDERCIEKARRGIPGVDFRVGRGEALPFKDASFDLVLFTLSLHHHQDMVLALHEAHRVLKPGSLALVIEPSAQGEVSRLFNLIDDESAELERALATVKSGPLVETGRETFTAMWVLEDFQELIDHLADQCGRILTREDEDCVKQILGDRADMSPFEIADDLVLISLIK